MKACRARAFTFSIKILWKVTFTGDQLPHRGIKMIAEKVITNYATDLKHKDFLKMSNFSSEQPSASVLVYILLWII